MSYAMLSPAPYTFPYSGARVHSPEGAFGSADGQTQRFPDR